MSQTAQTDAELLGHWSAGCRQSGNELLDRHFAVVHRFFRNKVGTDIEDLVQQTFIACIEARASYRHESSFKSFLLGIARYQLLTHYSKRSRELLDFTFTSVRDLGTSPSGQLAKREAERLLVLALQHVPLEAQIILELAYWEGMAGVELASALDVPLNTAYSRLHRAKACLRAKLRELAPNDNEADWMQSLVGRRAATEVT